MTQRLYNREVRAVFTDRKNPTDIITVEDPKIKGKAPIKIDFQVEKQLALGTLNRADLTITNLSDDTASKINFRKPVLDLIKFQEQRFGRKVDIFAGYEGQSRKIFSGVVVSAITLKDGPLKLTQIECINNFYELMRANVIESFSKGTPKSTAILKILSSIGATIEGRAKQTLIQRLSGQNFEDETNFNGTAYNVLLQIQRGVLGLINVYFDDVGARFNPVGIPNEDETERFYSQNNGLIGTPKPTEIGADFIVQLDNELSLGSPVAIDSPTIRAFFALGKFVVKQVIHSGSNDAEGDFQSRVTSVFNRSAIGSDLITSPAVA